MVIIQGQGAGCSTPPNWGGSNSIRSHRRTTNSSPFGPGDMIDTTVLGTGPGMTDLEDSPLVSVL